MKKQKALKLNEVSDFAAIDYLRFFCAILIVAIHIKPFEVFGTEVGFYAKNTLPRIAVPLFFMISGFFVFNKLEDAVKTKKYLLRILILYAVYSLIYCPYELSELLADKTYIPVYIRKVFVYGSFVHLWYLLALFFAVGAICLLHTKLKISIKKLLAVFAFLHIIGIMISIYRHLFDNTFLKTVIDRYYEIFFDIENFIFFGFYIVLGCYIRENAANIKRRNYAASAFLSFILFVAEVTINHKMFEKSDYQIAFFLVPTVLFIFLAVCFCGLSGSAKKHALFFRKQSVIIYLWHMMFYYFFNTVIPNFTGITLNRLEIFAAVISVNFVFAAVWIRLSQIKKLSFLNYLS